MPEIGLGIGYELFDYSWNREWMFWYDQDGHRYLTDREKTLAAESSILAIWKAREQERQSKEKLAAYLRTLGINPDHL